MGEGSAWGPPAELTGQNPQTTMARAMPRQTIGELNASPESVSVKAEPAHASRRYLLPALLTCFLFSGAAWLIDQVVWGKALGLIFGHTAYAVATVLAVFMGGLAAGSAWLGPRGERWSHPIAAYGWLELGVAATAAASLAGLAGVRAIYVAAYPYAAGNAAVLLVLRFAGSAIVLFLPTFLMGGTLPVLGRGLTRNAEGLCA